MKNLTRIAVAGTVALAVFGLSALPASAGTRVTGGDPDGLVVVDGSGPTRDRDL